MNKAPQALTLLLAGASAVAGLVYLQTNRYALTRMDRPFVTPLELEAPYSVAPEPVPNADDAPQDGMSDAAPVAAASPIARLRPVRSPTRPAELAPCTEWRDLGPVSISNLEVPRQRRVQMLCAKGTRPPAPDPRG